MNNKKNELNTVNLPKDIDINLYENIVSIASSMNDDNYIKENSDGSKYQIVDGFKCYITPKVIRFDKDRKIHFINNETFLVMYKDKAIRDVDKSLHEKNDVNFFDYQSPIVIGSIDSKDNYYLALKTRQNPNGRTDKKTYLGIILNPTIGIDNIKQLQQNQIMDILNQSNNKKD